MELLENGKVSESCRVATEFSLYSQDLAIILVSLLVLDLFSSTARSAKELL